MQKAIYIALYWGILVRKNMDKASGKVSVQYVLVIMLIALVSYRAKAAAICNIDSTKLTQCLPAVNGQSPPPPTKQCCTVVRHANLPCLCNYKSLLPAFGINPTHALALPKKCGLKTPPQCRGKYLKP
uniref:Bifunctional inhibitor/plant lipid transfer protein/seed storage helical domain-containing protein n=1 Tax=Fagus sylvatica TaxID=28930 RepID=A0A2N9GZW0_FAGSY